MAARSHNPHALPGTLIRQGAPNEPYMARMVWDQPRPRPERRRQTARRLYPGNAYQCVLRLFTNSGASWTEEPVTAKAGEDSQWDPVIAIDSANNVHVAWDGTGWAPIQRSTRSNTVSAQGQDGRPRNRSPISPTTSIARSWPSTPRTMSMSPGTAMGGAESRQRQHRLSHANREHLADHGNGRQLQRPEPESIRYDGSGYASNIHLAWNGTDRNTTPTSPIFSTAKGSPPAGSRKRS